MAETATRSQILLARVVVPGRVHAGEQVRIRTS